MLVKKWVRLSWILLFGNYDGYDGYNKVDTLIVKVTPNTAVCD